MEAKTTTETKGYKMVAKKTEVAKAVRVELKKAFSGIKFSVRAQAHSAVYVMWTDGPAAADVRNIVSKFELGQFDGMVDSYDFNNKRADVPQCMYVICCRDRSETVEA